MIDLTKAFLPDSVSIGGREYKVQTWFKYWLCVLRTLKAKKVAIKDLAFIFCDEIPDESPEDIINALVLFCNPRHSLPRPDISEAPGVAVMDYFQDADLIYSAFFEQYGIDLVEGLDLNRKQLHWYKFVTLVKGLHDTKFNKIVEYRSFDPNEKIKYKDHMLRMKAAWALDVPESDDSDLADFNKMFK